MNLQEKRVKQQEFKDRFQECILKGDLVNLQSMVEKDLITEENDVDFCFVDNEIAILFIGYQAGIMELQAGYNQFFSYFKDLASWTESYYKVKFAMRRLSCYNRKEVREHCVHVMQEENASIELMKVIANASIEKKERLFCRMAYGYFEAGLIDYVLPFLVAALDWDDNEENTIYTLSYLLYMLGQKELAVQYFESFKHWSELPQVHSLRIALYEDGKKEVLDYEELPLLEDVNKKEYAILPPCKFSFIQCVNQENFYEESAWYINQLKVPPKCEVEQIVIRNAKGICQGYNQGMKQANGEIKIYLHQDIMLVNPYILYELQNLYYMNDKIGMVGICGSKDIPANGIWFESKNQMGECFVDNILIYRHGLAKKIAYPYEPAMLMDGVFLATFHDVEWREDIFDRWHFYDVAQCMEMRRASYDTVLIHMDRHWCIHDGNIGEFEDESYCVYQKKFLQEYEKEIGTNQGN